MRNGFQPGVFLRGAAMGAADVVPGVSGGTIAFITGIYDELIDSLTSFNLHALRLLFREGPLAAWQYVNAGFLLNLLLGILLSVLSLARAISYALEHHGVPLSAFFFGLVLASALLVYRQISHRSVAIFALLLLGTAAALLIGELRPAALAVTPLSLFLSGALAICAMILPGISGSFILLLIGMYGPVIDAIKAFDVTSLALFAAGCVFGLMLFVRLLSWLMHHYRPGLLAFLSGLLLGSLTIIWPWKLNDAGLAEKTQSLALDNVWPWDYAATAPAQMGVSAALALFGVILVLAIERIAARSHRT